MRKTAASTEATATPEGITEVLPQSPATEPTVSEEAGIMETLVPEPLPPTPHTITELGIQPVALASATWASNFGPGGAAHTYKTLVFAPDGHIVHQGAIKFQNGALGEGGGINGMADSTLLSILADRWAAFQAGPFASEETGKALECIEQAAAWLNKRTAERTERGVQGKHEE